MDRVLQRRSTSINEAEAVAQGPRSCLPRVRRPHRALRPRGRGRCRRSGEEQERSPAKFTLPSRSRPPRGARRRRGSRRREQGGGGSKAEAGPRQREQGAGEVCGCAPPRRGLRQEQVVELSTAAEARRRWGPRRLEQGGGEVRGGGSGVHGGAPPPWPVPFLRRRSATELEQGEARGNPPAALHLPANSRAGEVAAGGRGLAGAGTTSRATEARRRGAAAVVMQQRERNPETALREGTICKLKNEMQHLIGAATVPNPSSFCRCRLGSSIRWRQSKKTILAMWPQITFYPKRANSAGYC